MYAVTTYSKNTGLGKAVPSQIVTSSFSSSSTGSSSSSGSSSK